jgi:hypothetical protein
VISEKYKHVFNICFEKTPTCTLHDIRVWSGAWFFFFLREWGLILSCTGFERVRYVQHKKQAPDVCTGQWPCWSDRTNRPDHGPTGDCYENRKSGTAAREVLPCRTMHDPTADTTRSQAPPPLPRLGHPNPDPSSAPDPNPSGRSQTQTLLPSPRLGPPPPTVMAAATEKSAEDIRRELQELQRQHREVRSPPPWALLRASVLSGASILTRSRPPRRSPSACAIPAAFAAASPALVLDPEGPVRSAASWDLYDSHQTSLSLPPSFAFSAFFTLTHFVVYLWCSPRLRNRGTSLRRSGGCYLPWLKLVSPLDLVCTLFVILTYLTLKCCLVLDVINVGRWSWN